MTYFQRPDQGLDIRRGVEPEDLIAGADIRDSQDEQILPPFLISLNFGQTRPRVCPVVMQLYQVRLDSNLFFVYNRFCSVIDNGNDNRTATE